jgi:hypothetical protein
LWAWSLRPADEIYSSPMARAAIARSAFKPPVVIGFGDLDNEVFAQPNRAAKSLCFFEQT